MQDFGVGDPMEPDVDFQRFECGVQERLPVVGVASVHDIPTAATKNSNGVYLSMFGWRIRSQGESVFC